MAKNKKNTAVTVAASMKAVVLTAVHVAAIPGNTLARLLASVSTAATIAVETARSNKRCAAVAAYDVAQQDEMLTGWLLLLCGVAWSYRLGRPCIGECNALRGCNKYSRWIVSHAELVRMTRDNASTIEASKQGLKDMCDYIERCSNEGKAITVAAPVDATPEEIEATATFNAALTRLPSVWQAHKVKQAAVATVAAEEMTQ